jgi:FtsP/CotA-like multicopper oxidase with cupredoxin domain
MNHSEPNSFSRRKFLFGGLLAGAYAALPKSALAADASSSFETAPKPEGHADYTIRIGDGLVELADDRILSTTTYNGQFPGPLLHLKEGRPVTVDIYNDTDTPEQLHWHGQFLPADVDGAAEEGTPYIPAHGMRRVTFTPSPAGFRFYHTHLVAGSDLNRGQYNGQVGPVYIEPKNEPGNYDREVFLVLKEFEPFFSRGGDMAMDFLAPATRVHELEDAGESSMRASLAKGCHMEVGYRSFAINGRMLVHGSRFESNPGRLLFHVLNGSATEVRSLALLPHSKLRWRQSRPRLASSGAVAGTPSLAIVRAITQVSGSGDLSRRPRARYDCGRITQTAVGDAQTTNGITVPASRATTSAPTSDGNDVHKQNAVSMDSTNYRQRRPFSMDKMGRCFT